MSLRFKEFQACPTAHWVKSTTIGIKYQAPQDLALTCSAGHSFYPPALLPSIRHAVQHGCWSGRPSSLSPTAARAEHPCTTKLQSSVYSLASDTRLQVPYWQGPSGICLCISRALCNHWNSRAYIEKEKCKTTLKSLTDPFGYLLILSNRFIWGT